MKILVFMIGSLGDTIVSVPAFRALKRHAGVGGELHLLQQALPGHRPLPEEILAPTGLVAGSVTYPPVKRRDFVRAFLGLRRAVKGNGFDTVAGVIPIGRSDRQLARDRIAYRLAGAKTLLGFQPLVPNPVDHPSKRSVHEAVARLRRLAQDGVETDEAADCATPLLEPNPEDEAKVNSWLARHRRYPERPLVAICQGTIMPSKQWPIDRFVELGRRIAETGQYEIVVVGSPIERETADASIKVWGQGLNACGEFKVLGSAGLLRRSALFIGLDTGPTHLAAAVGTEIVTLYADINYRDQWDPLGPFTMIRKEVPCAACFRTECNVEGHPCMEQITVDEVWEAVQRSIGRA